MYQINNQQLSNNIQELFQIRERIILFLKRNVKEQIQNITASQPKE